MNPTCRIFAADACIAFDARVAACFGHAMDMAGLRRGAAYYTGLPRAA